MNGLRGFAVLAVIYHHMFPQHIPPIPSSYGLSLPLLAPLNNGWLAVNLFFILSGFVLYLPFATGARTCDNGEQAMSFCWRRFKRLLPLYYFNALFLIGFVFFPPAPIGRNLFLMATLTFPFTTDQFMPWCNFVLWSFGIEFWFSVVFPLVLLLNRQRSIGKLCLVALAIGLATRYAAFLFLPEEYTSRRLDPIRASLPGRIDDFLIGMMVASWCARGEIPRRAALPLVIVGLLMLYATAMLWDWCDLGVLPQLVNPLLNNAVQVACVALLVGLLGLERGIVKWLFDNGPIQIVGMMCFSLYVWHAPLNDIVWAHRGSFPNGVIRSLFYVVTLFAMSLLSYRFIEFGTESNMKKLFRPA